MPNNRSFRPASKNRVRLGWILYIVGWPIWGIALGLPGATINIFGLLPVYQVLLLSILASWLYWAAVVASLIGPWIRTSRGWWFARCLTSLGFTESLYLAWSAYQEHLTGHKGLFLDVYPEPLRPGFPVLAIGSTLIGIGLWLIPPRPPAHLESPGFEPVMRDK